MDLLFRVTEEDIRQGVRRVANKCPVAYSLRRHFPKSEITVSATFDIQSGSNWWSATVRDRTATNSCHFILPYDIGQRIETYDKTGEMSPFSWTVSL